MNTEPRVTTGTLVRKTRKAAERMLADALSTVEEDGSCNYWTGQAHVPAHIKFELVPVPAGGWVLRSTLTFR